MRKRLSHQSYQSQILAQLDYHLNRGGFWTFVHNFHSLLGLCRLTAYRHSDEWLIVIQSIIHVNGAVNFSNIFWAYGNKIQPLGGPTLENVRLDYVVTDIDDPCPALTNSIYALNGQKHTIHYFEDLERQILARANLIRSGDACYDAIHKMLTAICIIHKPDELLLSNEYILGYLRKPCYWQPLVQTEEWENINYRQLPSQNSCYVSLANALAHSDARLFSYDPQRVNTTLKTIPSIW